MAEDSPTLASASKEDSSAMKTLAAGTVNFLPGTFVAAFFSMPLFQWNVDVTTSIVSNRFWMHWAVTVPLTILTIVSWFLWTRTMSSRHRMQDSMGRKKLWSDIDGSGYGTGDNHDV